MKVISSAELRNNMKKYLDTARTETVVIQRGRTETFVLTKQDNLPEDLNRAISMDDAILRVEEGMREIIKNKKI
ncbi:MAG: hypothetical protein A2W86_00130 [Bacteroidetes bacterium GWD2_45_23]|nr:hypothetical protein [Porphyromonadaceae bacterium]OFX54357.1 MAG: hypothetical protein A2W87_04650 [Bacteroidetes bacterium GWC2_46_850]OFX86450.1 MAG: hypothetical protein A2W86_00130 [Bacteroidetes bacterium GWD2_45_23]HBB00005.1 type II toxin-antitoxin system Phd/YefM family antitoxin [Porphyromonadaceae bacterium]HCC16938.1 type II toxin-antitoxin system Phd/YefM family antitoxin [Porphyromonadaceae bacterium]